MAKAGIIVAGIFITLAVFAALLWLVVAMDRCNRYDRRRRAKHSLSYMQRWSRPTYGLKINAQAAPSQYEKKIHHDHKDRKARKSNRDRGTPSSTRSVPQQAATQQMHSHWPRSSTVNLLSENGDIDGCSHHSHADSGVDLHLDFKPTSVPMREYAGRAFRSSSYYGPRPDADADAASGRSGASPPWPLSTSSPAPVVPDFTWRQGDQAQDEQLMEVDDDVFVVGDETDAWDVDVEEAGENESDIKR